MSEWIKCDVDGRLEEIGGPFYDRNFPDCGHKICDTHVIYGTACPMPGCDGKQKHDDASGPGTR